ncbi:MAG TPA: T9SS type A sorting domain-containing protein [bacterium]|nr:T9SS type A sorting domain-containing protein [bacterium]
MGMKLIFWLKIILCTLLSVQYSASYAQQVLLTWGKSTENDIVNYAIYRKADPNSGFLMIGKIASSDTNYYDSDVRWGAWFGYAVTSIDQSGKESDFSNFVEVNIPDQMLELNEFSGFVQQNKVILQWSAYGIQHYTSFEVQQKSDNTDYFSTIGFVQTVDEISNYRYQYVIDAPEVGKNFYRVKILFNDGTVCFSQIIEVDTNVPQQFYLEQNYPNPFNSSTNIRYGIEKYSHVQLKIFNVNGQEMRCLVAEYQQPGRYVIKWDGEDMWGKKLPSGIYFYQLNVPGTVMNRRLIYLK